MFAQDRDDKDDLLQSLIAQILESESHAEPVDRDGMIEANPDLADSLREFFARHDRMKLVAEVDPPTLPPSESVEEPTLPPSFVVEDATIPPTAELDDRTLPPTEPASSKPQPAIGDKVRYFGDYELLEEIARGGMGVVYKARQMNLNRIVALKMILSGEFAGEEDVQRFHTEAEAAATLDHPGIVPIFEIGEHQGQHYFSMGYIEGESLAQKVADGPLPPREAAQLVKKICEAMAYAHERGVIHRDLKPANILIDPNGQPKVTDFGLAKKTEADSNLTGTGQILGTPAYMPPEQASGKTDVGPLADVYSMGAILYCLLTGRPPFQAASPMDTLLQVLDQEPVSPRSLTPNLPLDIDTICLKCLSKDSTRRYASSDQLRSELARYLEGQPILARPVGHLEKGWRWCLRNPAVASLSALATLCLVVGFIVSIYFAIKAGNEAEFARTKGLEAITKGELAETRAAEAEAAKAKAETETARATEANQQLGNALARSNYFLAMARWDADRAAEAVSYLHRVPEEQREIEWYLASREFLGSDLTLYGHTQPVASVEFSPDGSLVASGGFGAGATVRIWDSATGKTIRELTEFSTGASSLAFSPSGKRLASAHASTVRVWDLRSGDLLNEISGHNRSVESVVFLSSESRLATTADKIRVWDTDTGEELKSYGEENANVDYRTISLSPDERYAVSVGFPDTTIWDLDSGQLAWKLDWTLQLEKDAWYDPSGSQVILVGDQLQYWDLINKSKLRSHVLEANNALVSDVAMSPDRMIVATAKVNHLIDLWDMKTGEHRRTLKGHTRRVNQIAFSPDGRRLVSAGADKTVKIWNLDESSTTAQDLSPLDPLRPKLVPDGEHHFTLVDAGSEREILRYAVPQSSKGQESLKMAVVSHGGEKVATVSRLGKLQLWDISSGRENTLGASQIELVDCVAFSHDEMKLVLGAGPNDFGHTIHIWDLESNVELLQFAGHDEIINDVEFSEDDKLLLSASGYGMLENQYGGTVDKSIRVWDAESGAELARLTGHASDVIRAKFSRNGMRILSASRDKTVRLWDIRTGEELRKFDLQEWPESISFGDDDQQLLTRLRNGSFRRWDARPGAEHRLGQVVVDELMKSGEWVHPQGERVRFSKRVLANHRFLETGSLSVDGRWLALPISGGMTLTDLDFGHPPDRQASFVRQVKLNTEWHHQRALAAASQGEWYLAAFHRAWELRSDPTSPSAYYGLRTALKQIPENQRLAVKKLPQEASSIDELPQPPITIDFCREFCNDLWKRYPIGSEARPSASEIQILETMCEQFPTATAQQLALGQMQVILGDYQAAVPSLRRALANGTNNQFAAIAYLAICHLQLGDTGQANAYRSRLMQAIKSGTVKAPELRAELDRVFQESGDQIGNTTNSSDHDSDVDGWQRPTGFSPHALSDLPVLRIAEARRILNLTDVQEKALGEIQSELAEYARFIQRSPNAHDRSQQKDEVSLIEAAARAIFTYEQQRALGELASVYAAATFVTTLNLLRNESNLQDLSITDVQREEIKKLFGQYLQEGVRYLRSNNVSIPRDSRSGFFKARPAQPFSSTWDDTAQDLCRVFLTSDQINRFGQLTLQNKVMKTGVNVFLEDDVIAELAINESQTIRLRELARRSQASDRRAFGGKRLHALYHAGLMVLDDPQKVKWEARLGTIAVSHDAMKPFFDPRLLSTSENLTERHLYATALQDIGEFETARSHFHDIVEVLEREVGDNLMKPSTPFRNQPGVTLADAYASLANLNLAEGDDVAENAAWSSLVSLLQQDPVDRDPRYWQILGQGLYRMGRNQDALQALEKSIALKSESRPTTQGGPRWWFLTMALAKTGETNRATQYYKLLSKRASTSPDTQLKDEARNVLESTASDSEVD